MRVFVKNKRGEALMPCSQKRARELLRDKKAKIFSYNPFTIQLTEATGESTQPVNVGIDTGARFIGVAITSQNNVLAKGEVELRQDVSDRVTARAILRRARRIRNTRYREKRILNRKRKPGWLPPSVKSRVDSTFFWIDKFYSLVPNPELHIEVGKFDIAMMINPDISGTGYQDGNTKGFYDVRYYVFARDHYTCQACKKQKKILRTHHIVYESCGGTNRADNLITVCDDCHTAENHKPGGIFYKWMRAHKTAGHYKDPTFMNIVRKRIMERYPNAVFTYGSETTPRRIAFGLKKTHYNDAIVISGIAMIGRNTDAYFCIRQFRKKKRSLHEQIPRKGLKAPNIAAKRNCKNVRERGGVRMNDLVRCGNLMGWVYGFACGEKYGACVVRGVDGEIVREPEHPKSSAIGVKKLERVCHNNGWQYTEIAI